MEQSLFANLILSTSNQKLLRQIIFEFPKEKINWMEEIIFKKEKMPLYLYALNYRLQSDKIDELEFFQNFVKNLIKDHQINIHSQNFINILIDKNTSFFIDIFNEYKDEYLEKLTNKQKISLLKKNDFNLLKSLSDIGVDFFNNINPLLYTTNEQSFRFLLNQNKIDIEKPLFNGHNLILYLIKEQKLTNVLNSYIQKNKKNEEIFNNGIFENNIENVVMVFHFLKSPLLKRVIENFSNEDVLSFNMIDSYFDYMNQKINKKEYSTQKRNELQENISSLRSKGHILMSVLFENANSTLDIENAFLNKFDDIKKNLTLINSSNFYEFVKHILDVDNIDKSKIIQKIITEKNFSPVINNNDYEFTNYLFEQQKKYITENNEFIYNILVNSIGMAIAHKQDNLYTTFEATIDLINNNFPDKQLSKIFSLLGNKKNKGIIFKNILDEGIPEFMLLKKDLEDNYPEIHKKIFENKSSFIHKNKEIKALYESVIIKSSLSGNITTELNIKKRL